MLNNRAFDSDYVPGDIEYSSKEELLTMDDKQLESHFEDFFSKCGTYSAFFIHLLFSNRHTEQRGLFPDILRHGKLLEELWNLYPDRTFNSQTMEWQVDNAKGAKAEGPGYDSAIIFIKAVSHIISKQEIPLSEAEWEKLNRQIDNYHSAVMQVMKRNLKEAYGMDVEVENLELSGSSKLEQALLAHATGRMEGPIPMGRMFTPFYNFELGEVILKHITRDRVLSKIAELFPNYSAGTEETQHNLRWHQERYLNESIIPVASIVKLRHGNALQRELFDRIIELISHPIFHIPHTMHPGTDFEETLSPISARNAYGYDALETHSAVREHAEWIVPSTSHKLAHPRDKIWAEHSAEVKDLALCYQNSRLPVYEKQEQILDMIIKARTHENLSHSELGILTQILSNGFGRRAPQESSLNRSLAWFINELPDTITSALPLIAKSITHNLDGQDAKRGL